jgi:hypothetical protein
LGSAPKTASESRLERVFTLTFIVMGTKAEAQFVAKALSAELLIVEGAGQYPQTEMQEQVIPGVLDFLGKANNFRSN